MSNDKREWDDLLDGLKQSVDTKSSTSVNSKPIEREAEPSSSTEAPNSNYTDPNVMKSIFIVLAIVAIIFIFFLPKSGGTSSGKKTLASGSGYKVTGVVRINGNEATIDATLKVDRAGAYQVNVSIYSKSGQYLGSNSKIFYLGADDSASVYFHISNLMGGGTPEKYSVSVTRG